MPADGLASCANYFGSWATTSLVFSLPVTKAGCPLIAKARTRISCHAAPERTACAPFHEERRMKHTEATRFHRKSGGGPTARLQPSPAGLGNRFRNIVRAPEARHPEIGSAAAPA